MTAYNIVNPGSLVPGQPEDVTQVLANLQAIQSVVNGSLDNSNIAVGANIDPAKISGGIGGVPTGCVLEFAGSAAPSGFLLCDGSAVSRSIYATLFGIISTTYGVGDGSSTFNVPDVRGRVIVGVGTVAAVNAIGKNENQAVGSRQMVHSHSSSHNLTLPNHGHNVSDPTHAHGNSFTLANYSGGTGNGVFHAQGTSQNAGYSITNQPLDGGISGAGTGIGVGNPTSLPGISGAVTVGAGMGGDSP